MATSPGALDRAQIEREVERDLDEVYRRLDEVNRKIALLGADDPDPDLEEDDPPEDDDPREIDAGDGERDECDREPSLASPELGLPWHPVSQEFWAQGGRRDSEEENEHGGDINDEGQLDEGDDEPSLASTGSVDQEHWAAGRADDLEDEHDGREQDFRDFPCPGEEFGP